MSVGFSAPPKFIIVFMPKPVHPGDSSLSGFLGTGIWPLLHLNMGHACGGPPPKLASTSPAAAKRKSTGIATDRRGAIMVSFKKEAKQRTACTCTSFFFVQDPGVMADAQLAGHAQIVRLCAPMTDDQ